MTEFLELLKLYFLCNYNENDFNI